MDDKQRILLTEFSHEFVDKMQNAMCVSFYKYGAVKNAYPVNADAIKSLHKRLEMYAETGNTEYLVDVANFAMIEFMHPAHPQAHYTATDSDGSPGRYSRTRGDLTQDDNDTIGLSRREKAKRERERRIFG